MARQPLERTDAVELDPASRSANRASRIICGLQNALTKRRMHKEFVDHLGGSAAALPVTAGRIAERQAQLYLAHGPLAGAGRRPRFTRCWTN